MKSYQGELRISRAGSWQKLGVSLEPLLHLASPPDQGINYKSTVADSRAVTTWTTHPPPPEQPRHSVASLIWGWYLNYSNWSHLGYPSSKIQWLTLGCGSELAHFPSTLQALCFISALRGKKKASNPVTRHEDFWINNFLPRPCPKHKDSKTRSEEWHALLS